MIVQTPRVDEHTRTLRAENDGLRKILMTLHERIDEAMEYLAPPITFDDAHHAYDILARVHYKEEAW